MKKLHYLFLVPFALSTVFISCEDLNLNDILGDDDVAAALKEALNVGTDTAVTKGSALNGYLLNPDISIFFPEEAGIVQTVVGAVPGGDDLIDAFIVCYAPSFKIVFIVFKFHIKIHIIIIYISIITVNVTVNDTITITIIIYLLLLILYYIL